MILVGRILPILLALADPALAARVYDGSYESKVPAAATRGGEVDGTIYFRVYESEESDKPRSTKPIRNCLLQHGYGITQDLIDSATVAATLGHDTLEFFASMYFGKHLIHELLERACDSVFVAVQESNNTSLLEMTRRTEEFLAAKVCNVNKEVLGQLGQIACALIGHSKGGAVAYTTGRRCMEENPDSRLGEAGCKQLGKIYSATGVVQGASIPALLLGAKYRMEEAEDEADVKNAEQIHDSVEKLEDLFSITLLQSGSVVWDLKSDFTEGYSNPTWLDLSPLAPMENGVPIYLANGGVLENRGWLVADYSASGTNFDFGTGEDAPLWGCSENRGNAPSDLLERLRWHEQRKFCQNFGKSLGLIHSPLHKGAFDYGKTKMKEFAAKFSNLKKVNGSVAFLDEALSWNSFQHGDGFADYELALRSCLRAVGKRNSAVQSKDSCRTFHTLNHQATAGGAEAAWKHIVDQLVIPSKKK